MDIKYCIDKLNNVNKQFEEETSSKDRCRLATDLLEIADDIQHIAIDELENLILKSYEVLQENQYTSLFMYYKEKEHWNTDIIIRLIEEQKLGKLPRLNYFCDNNMKFLILSLIEAIKSDISYWLYECPIEESIKSLNNYFNIITDNCPAEDKESTKTIINDMKEECADAFADRIAENKKSEYDELREEHYNDYYIEQCDEVLKFAPDNKRVLSLKNYFLEQKLSDIENGLDEE